MDNKNWDSSSIEILQSFERGLILKAINEAKNLVKKIMEAANQEAGNNNVSKLHVQNAILRTLDLSMKEKSS